MKYLSFMLVLFIGLMAGNAQNMGEQYTTKVWSPISESYVTFISENPPPEEELYPGMYMLYDSLALECEKDWANMVAIEPFNITQTGVQEKFYLASFQVDTALYFVCLNDECRWRYPRAVEPTADEPFELHFDEQADWPAFTLYFQNDRVIRQDQIKLLETGEVLTKEYFYVQPFLWQHIK